MSRARAHALLLAGVALMTACAPEARTALPDPPAPLERPDEYAFGDRVAAAEERALRRATQSLGEGFGKPVETRFVAPAEYDFAALRRWYAERAEAGGWTPLAALAPALGRDADGLGYVRDGEAVLLIWLPDADAAAVPVTLMRFGG